MPELMKTTDAEASAVGGSESTQTPCQARAADTCAVPSASQSAAAQRRKYLSLKEVGQKFGVGERTAHKIINEPWMPPPIELRPRVRRWIEEEIDAAVLASAPRRSERKPEPEALARGRVARVEALAA